MQRNMELLGEVLLTASYTNVRSLHSTVSDSLSSLRCLEIGREGDKLE